MFEEDFENMSVEEQENFVDCMERMFEDLALGNGDYTLNSEDEIVIDY
ncbi:hypothetical protein [Lysinibacillus sphaericus]|nr:hypothetical protein [Lysinibacillus sphaericus]QPA58350.1 hypothetical protein INQ55_20155 [Lysinibacillus sphaericus]